MTDASMALADGGPDDLPRTFRRERDAQREAREREARERAAAEDFDETARNLVARPVRFPAHLQAGIVRCSFDDTIGHLARPIRQQLIQLLPGFFHVRLQRGKLLADRHDLRTSRRKHPVRDLHRGRIQSCQGIFADDKIVRIQRRPHPAKVAVAEAA